MFHKVYSKYFIINFIS